MTTRFSLKEKRSSYFCVIPKNHRLIIWLIKILKITVTKKVIARFNNLREENV